MSLYNTLFGQNPLASILKEILCLESGASPEWPKIETGEKKEVWDPYDDPDNPDGKKYIQKCIDCGYYPIGRFRDIYYDPTSKHIVLYTRNGGGNRDAYFYVFDIIKKHPNYLNDYDDGFDSTYAYIEFSVPPKFQKLFEEYVTSKEIETVHDKFQKLFKKMEGMSKEELENDKQLSPLVEIIKKIGKTAKEKSKKENKSTNLEM
jgi:hypothetical protein